VRLDVRVGFDELSFGWKMMEIEGIEGLNRDSHVFGQDQLWVDRGTSTEGNCRGLFWLRLFCFLFFVFFVFVFFVFVFVFVFQIFAVYIQ
jgi:hypothetical protein